AREGVPAWLASTMPSPALLDRAAPIRVGPGPEGWPRVVVVDRRNSDPHEGALAPAALEAARAALGTEEPVAVVVVLQRLGTGAPLACRRCGELARCPTCHQAEREVDGELTCAEGHGRRARFCLACGSTALRRVGPGVTTLARDVAAQLGRPVSEVTATSAPETLERVVVGTEAALTRVRRCGLVVFADLDQYLLAPRASARRAAVQVVGRAGRLVGPRSAPRGSVLVQTRRGDDDVVTALVRGDVADLSVGDDALARDLGLPPYGALAVVSGDGAREFAAGVSGNVEREDAGAEITLRASSLDELLDALALAARPATRVRVAVE
ncbi:MAG TPA: hypothetical protein VGS61_05075, partial [Acidimicrobiales bacterium]|nr:hypothetical protein [Acidimicrobiales bacterium]